MAIATTTRRMDGLITAALTTILLIFSIHAFLLEPHPKEHASLRTSHLRRAASASPFQTEATPGIAKAFSPTPSPSIPTSTSNGILDMDAASPSCPCRAFRHKNLQASRSTTNVESSAHASPTVTTVVAWPYAERNKLVWPQEMHLLGDGIAQSPHLQLSNNANDFGANVLWVADSMRGGSNNGSKRQFKKDQADWCQKFGTAVGQAQEKRRHDNSTATAIQWPIFIMDYNDSPRLLRCPNIEAMVGPECVFYSKRSTVQNRQWNDTKAWVDPGTPHSNVVARDPRRGEKNGLAAEQTLSLPMYQHTPYYVRTDTVQTLEQRLVSKGKGLTLQSPIETVLLRKTDVSHFWPLPRTANETHRDGKDDKMKIEQESNRLRDSVSQIVDGLGRAFNFSTFVGIAGASRREGRTNVTSAYVDQLLDSKIVVVSQRDDWQGHFRLMEALVSGALVLTDFLHHLPSGLINGTNIVMYQSESELRHFIQHYLKLDQERVAIAARGRRVAMERHRTWHRMEEVIFGQSLTQCHDDDTGNGDDSTRDTGMSSPSSCAFVVDAADMKHS